MRCICAARCRGNLLSLPVNLSPLLPSQSSVTVSPLSTYHPAFLSLSFLHLPQYLGYRDQILRFNLSPALWTHQCSQTGRVSLGFKKSFALLKHSFIGAMFKPLRDIPWTSATLQLSLIHYLIPPL